MKVIIEARLHADHAITRGLRLLREVYHNAKPQPGENARPGECEVDTVSHDLVETIGTHLQESERALEQLNDHTDAADGDTFEASVVGDGADDLGPGMVLIDCGPVAIEVSADEIRRAVLPFIGDR